MGAYGPTENLWIYPQFLAIIACGGSALVCTTCVRTWYPLSIISGEAVCSRLHQIFFKFTYLNLNTLTETQGAQGVAK